jgi:hypothetical protein
MKSPVMRILASYRGISDATERTFAKAPALWETAFAMADTMAAEFWTRSLVAVDGSISNT